MDAPGTDECILMLDGRLMGDSAVVMRRLRSELSEDDESLCEGRFGRLYSGACVEPRNGAAACGMGGVAVLLRAGRWTFWSARKSIHVSPSRPLGGCWARKCDATTPCE